MPRYRERRINHVRFIWSYEDLLQQIHSHHDLIDFRKIVPPHYTHQQVRILVQEKDESQTRIRF
ncbi:TMH-family membrane domain protein [Chlamydia psittaci GR9]|nr:TMH-family membrane domain protein [Chlamydia psittaci GR9]